MSNGLKIKTCAEAHRLNEEEDSTSNLIEWMKSVQNYMKISKVMSEGNIRNFIRGIVNLNAQMMCEIEILFN